MPPAGFVGVKLTPQRKLMLSEVMQTGEFAKPSEALDFVLALASDYVKPDESELTELPNFLNYYVGDTNPVIDNGTVAPLVAQERVSPMVSKLTWRIDALSYIRNIEPTIVNVADAIDFALSAYIMHSRAGTLATERVSEVREQVKRNAVAFKQEVQAFLQDNMKEQEREARKLGTKTVKSKRSVADRIASDKNIINGQLIHLYRKQHNEGDTASLGAEIANLEKKLSDLDLELYRTNMKDMSEKAKTRSAAIRTDAEGSKSVIPF